MKFTGESSENGGSEEAMQWEQEEYWAMRKAVLLFFLKTVFVALAQILDLPRFTFSVTLFVFFFLTEMSKISHSAPQPLSPRDEEGTILTVPSPSPGPESQGLTSDVQPAAHRELGPC